jgi:hypothetical protein
MDSDICCLASWAGGQPFRIFLSVKTHGWIIPLQYVNAE